MRNKLPQTAPANTTNPVTMTDVAQPSTSGIVTVTATTEEMQTAIEAQLSLGSDMPPPDMEVDENAALVPLVPQVPDLGPPYSKWMKPRLYQ